MSQLINLFERMLGHKRDDVVEHLCCAVCRTCGKKCWGEADVDVQQAISRHGVFNHDQPPAEH